MITIKMNVFAFIFSGICSAFLFIKIFDGIIVEIILQGYQKRKIYSLLAFSVVFSGNNNS